MKDGEVRHLGGEEEDVKPGEAVVEHPGENAVGQDQDQDRIPPAQYKVSERRKLQGWRWETASY